MQGLHRLGPSWNALPRDCQDQSPQLGVESAQQRHFRQGLEEAGGGKRTGLWGMAGVGLEWLAISVVSGAPAGATPVGDRVSPPAGQVGNIVMLEGSGLAGDNLEVKFGRAPALNLRNPGG